MGLLELARRVSFAYVLFRNDFERGGTPCHRPPRTGSSKPTGSQPICPPPTWSSSTAAGICRPQAATPKEEYLAEHIPGALFFDIDDLTDEKSSLPHMLPSTVKFASRMKKMGIGDGVRIVVYDTNGIFSAARVWWTFRAMGHEDVAVLNGGLKKWKAEGRRLEDGPPAQAVRTALHAVAKHRNHSRPRRNEGAYQQARHADRRCASRRPLRGQRCRASSGFALGPYSGCKNVPSQQLLNADGTFKSAAELGELFKDAGIDSRSRSLPRAARASRRRCWPWRSPCSGRRTRPSTTAVGPSGARHNDLPVETGAAR